MNLIINLSTFDYNINSKHSNIIWSIVYRLPTMVLNEFNDKYKNKSLHNLSKETVTLLFPGDFNRLLKTWKSYPYQMMFFTFSHPSWFNVYPTTS